MPYPFFVFCWENTNIYVKGNIMTKKKQFVILAIFVVLAIISCVSALVVVLTASNQASTSKVNVDYTASDVYVKIKANYYIGSNTVAMVNGDSTEVVLSPINHSGSLNQPNAKTTSALMDVDSGGKVVFEYIFENLSGTVPAKISQMTNADGTPYVPTDTYNNVNVQYVGTSKVMGASAYGGKDTISDIAILPLSTKYIYVIVSVKDLMHDVQYKGSFGWMLSRADLVDNTTENVSGGTIISGTDDADVVNKDEMDKINLVLDCENEKPNSYPQKSNKCFTGWYTKDESGNDIEVEWPAMITSTTNIYPKYENETPGLSYTYTGDGYAIVGGYNGSTSNIFVPDIHNDGTHGNAKITSIASRAFSGNTKITNLVVPNTITTIGNNAFNSCEQLTTVYIPKSVVSIGSGVFLSCNSITNIVVEEGNPKYDSRNNCNAIIETATDTLVSGCNYTIIPNGVKVLGASSFDRMRLMTDIVIPDSVETIKNAFNYCSNLTNVTMPSSLKHIYDYAFNATNIEELYLPSNVIYIGTRAFINTINLKKIVVSTNNTKYDSRNNCNAIVETATNKLIVGCVNTTIPDTVTTIGSNAFNGQTGLTRVVISRGVNNIDATAFTNCGNMSEIIVDSANAKYDSRNNCNAIIETATNTLVYGCKNTIIPNTITTIGASSFSQLLLNTITIPDSVTKICSLAFHGSSITNINIPRYVSVIEDRAFGGCSRLTSIVVDSANAKYDSRNNCNAIIETASNTLVAGSNNTTIPNTVTAVGDYAFYNLGQLTSITIPDSVTSIGENVFYLCSSLSEITLSSNLVSIGYRAFNACGSLTSIVIPASVKYMGVGVFIESQNLTSVEFKAVTGWKVYDNPNYTNGTSIDISSTDFYQNATYLKSVYASKYWKKD